VERTCLHELLDIIVAALCAVIGSADMWVDLETWSNVKLDWLRQYVSLHNGAATMPHTPKRL
jgi:DDE family transposase